MGVKKIIFHNEKPGRLIICTVLLPVIVMVSWILLALASCRLPEQAFQEINISEKIDSQTGQPVSPQNKFSISTKHVYASVRYSGVKGEDTWRFKWINTGTQETVLDSQKQYSSEKPQSYFEGTVYSSISTNDASKIIAPGTYRVEFYNNDEIKKTATFEIAKPEMQILKIELASSIDSLGNPLTVASQFKQGETLYACIKMDYLIPGNTLRALLKNENGEELIEEEITIDENYYNQSYRWFSFTISPGSRLFVTGNYKVEIFL